MLNKKSSFCFITSNSWLDANYGSDLQEILLKHGHIKLIIDNEKKRSFKADVNTIIALLSPLDDRRDLGLNNTARFVMFRVPFEEVIDAETFKTLESVTTDRQNTEKWRICVKSHCELFADGLKRQEEEEEEEGEGEEENELIAKLKTVHVKTNKYMANKWGGKYLRAPEIFFTVLDKGKDKLVRLGDISNVKPGCYSGINDFFYLDKQSAKQLGIESRFLKPIIRNTSDAISPFITLTDLDTVVFSCNLDKDELQSFKGANNYIDWGARQVTRARQKTEAGIPWPETETVKRRTPGWWTIPRDNLTTTRNFLLYVHNERFIAPFTNKPVTSDRCFHRIFLKEPGQEASLAAILNSTVTWLMICVYGRWGLGQGAMKFETSDACKLLLLNPATLNAITQNNLATCLETLGKRAVQAVKDEVLLSDRHALDSVVFDVLRLTSGEREAVYEAVVNLVRARLEKAKSV
ncbi:MAG TPA: hypothetical protein PKH10_00815 [bacterium]|nr:hypothetical protein [bacterium]